MKIELDLNADEALALIQICERDILFPEVSTYVIDRVEKYRHEWANNVRNLAYLRANNGVDVYVRPRNNFQEHISNVNRSDSHDDS